MIVVTVAGGNIGGPLIRRLLESGVATRVIARDPAKAAAAWPGAEVVDGDVDKPDTLLRAFDGADKLFLLAPSGMDPAQDVGLVRAAMAARVPHVVMLSSLGIEFGGVGSGAVHAVGEEMLKSSSLPWTILHPAEFMTNTRWWTSTISGASSIFVPSGSGTVGMIDPADIGYAAAAVLTSDGHVGQTYRLTGPDALTTADIAAALTEVLGRPIRHVDVPEAAFVDGMRQAGLPPQAIDLQTRYYAAMKAGRIGLVSPDVEALTGTPPRRFLDWARENVAAFS